MHPVLLFYNLENSKGRTLKMLCLRLKIKIRIITKEQYNQTLGALAGIDGFPLKEEVYTGDGFTDEMLVFKGFDNALLDRFLVEFKKLHLTRIGLKAVLTEHNINWDSIALHEELKEYNIKVSVLCPGPTKTEFFDVANSHKENKTLDKFMMDSYPVVRKGVSDLKQNKPISIVGLSNHSLRAVLKLVPRTFASKIVGKIQKKSR